MNRPKGYGRKMSWWQEALISVAVSFLGGLSAMKSQKDRQKIYTQKLEQAPWAPPAWLFGPAWALNNFFLIDALRNVLQKDIPEKNKLLALQAGIWGIFFSFNFVYFRKESPILAAVWTMADMALAIASLVIGLKSDKKIGLAYVPLALWTTYASSLAAYQVLKNPDPVFRSRAMLN